MTRTSGPHHNTLMEFALAVVAGDTATASRLLAASPDLPSACLEEGASRRGPEGYFFDEIKHYLYAGDTALHVAAAAYQHEIARKLITAGANVRARNRRGAEPLHYAVDGGPGSPTWNPSAQAAIVASLIAAGTDPNTVDESGVTPLHRAVRTRCTAAVKVLLEVAPISDAGTRTVRHRCRSRHDDRPRRQRLAGGQSATSTDRASAGAARRGAIMTGVCS
jgi:hypothetical protein